jgi:hypothetical protein
MAGIERLASHALESVGRLRESHFEGAMARLGCVEVLEQEKPYEDDIRWLAFQARCLLKGLDYMVTQSVLETEDPSYEELGRFYQQCRKTSDTLGAESKSLSLPCIVETGVLRRVKLPERAKLLNSTLAGEAGQRRLINVWKLIKSHGERLAAEKLNPPQKILVLTHKGKFSATQSWRERVKHMSGRSKTFLDKIFPFINAAMSQVSMPYPGG